jgi:hypothetical protein
MQTAGGDMYSRSIPPCPSRLGRAVVHLNILKVSVFTTVEAQEPSALIRAFNRAHKDVVERLSGVDFASISPEAASATWERTEQEILLETNRKHDWEHRKSPWFRLYYDFF